MLTNVYYYNIYKPYIVSSTEKGAYTPKWNRIADRKTSAEPSTKIYVLNKSHKNEIIDFAHNVSLGVNGFRTTARMAAIDMKNFDREVGRGSYEKAQKLLGDDLEKFANRYNEAVDFMLNQGASVNLRLFSYEVTDNLRYNREELDMLGLNFTEDGKLTFDKTYFNELSTDGLRIAMNTNIDVFTGFQKQGEAFLTAPLAAHMGFKGLGYHYNYKMGKMEMDGYSIIETGLIVNKAV